jgi:hypothetical protein
VARQRVDVARQGLVAQYRTPERASSTGSEPGCCNSGRRAARSRGRRRSWVPRPATRPRAATARGSARRARPSRPLRRAAAASGWCCPSRRPRVRPCASSSARRRSGRRPANRSAPPYVLGSGSLSSTDPARL